MKERFRFLSFGSTLFPVFFLMMLVTGSNVPAVGDDEGQDPRLLFYASFDGTTTADVAGGQNKPVAENNLSFEPGLVGQALRLDGESSSLLEYASQGNLPEEQGTIGMWIKRDLSKNTPWQVLLTQRWTEKKRVGSGALWFWLYDGNLRADTSDSGDRYLSCELNQNEAWHYVTMTWNRYRKHLYLDGQLVLSDSRKESHAAAPSRPYEYDRLPFDSFLIGNYNNWSFCGLIDELKIWSAPLTPEAVTAIAESHRDVIPPNVTFRIGNHCQFADEPIRFPITVTNHGPIPVQVTLTIQNAEKETLRESSFEAASGETSCPFSADGLEPGTVNLTMSVNNRLVRQEPLWIFHAPATVAEESTTLNTTQNTNPNHEKIDSASPWPSPLQLKLVEEMDMTQIPPERFSAVGDICVGTLNGTSYIETDNKANCRFAFHLPPLDVAKLYCLEFEWPDDKQRSIDVLAQSPRMIDEPDENEYEFQVGCVTGDEYPNTNKIVVQRCLLHPRNSDESILFMCARNTEGGAAVACLRLYEIEGPLPVANMEPAVPINGWTRPVGIYFEDPALGYDFGNFGYKPENWEGMIDRLIAYMKFSGQNMLCYPLVWYNGYIGGFSNPRQHPADFIDGILTKFDRAGLEFMATINQNEFCGIRPVRDFVLQEPVDDALRPYINGMPPFTQEDIDSGALHNSPLTIQRTGLPHPPEGWHDTSPIFNPLHPAIQQMTQNNVREILRRCKDHPSFKGIILHLPRHSLNSLGDIESGYNDYMVEAFEHATGQHVAVDREDPSRGRLYYEWLHENAWDAWIHWRCEAMANCYKKLADLLREARPDLKLGINAMTPILYSSSHYDATDQRDFWDEINREAGIDAACFADTDNMFIEQTIFPADYRWTQDRSRPEIRERLRNTEETRGQYASLLRGHATWVNQHDRYWESAVGRESREENDPAQSLDTSWLREHPWHVTTLNPLGFYALKHYILPLRYKDVQGLSKGGFLIGSYGMEEYLTPFIRAFRALPAVEFNDLPGSTDTIKVRSWSDDKSTWFYFANTSTNPAEVVFQIDQPGLATCWSQTQTTINLAPENHLLTPPLSLTVYRLNGTHHPAVKSISP